MAETATLTLTLDPALRDRFLAAADAALRSPEDLLRELVRQFAEGRASADLAEIHRAVREADAPGRVLIDDEEVEAEWLRQREALLHRVGAGAT